MTNATIGTLRYAGDITGEDYMLILDSQDLESLHHSVPTCPDEMTGALVIVDDGDYVEVWATESSRPYSVNATYERII